MKVLQHVRNESHRFGITRHRNRRSKNAFNSELENIKGIGEQSIKDLLKHFKSVERIKHAEQKELEEVLGCTKRVWFSNTFTLK